VIIEFVFLFVSGGLASSSDVGWKRSKGKPALTRDLSAGSGVEAEVNSFLASIENSSNHSNELISNQNTKEINPKFSKNKVRLPNTLRNGNKLKKIIRRRQSGHDRYRWNTNSHDYKRQHIPPDSQTDSNWYSANNNAGRNRATEVLYAPKPSKASRNRYQNPYQIKDMDNNHQPNNYMNNRRPGGIVEEEPEITEEVKPKVFVKVVEVDVPKFVNRTEDVRLECKYNLTVFKLYSLKWYRNDVEIFRFMPNEDPQKMAMLPSRELDVSI